MWGAQGWNQWALQPAMFNDVPHEQIDWAALAKQWIQMQQSQSSDSAATSVLPQVPPTTIQTAIPPPPPPGHGPLPEEYPPDQNIGVVPLLKTPVVPGSMPEHFQTERSLNVEPATFVPKPVSNTYWNKAQWEASAAEDIDERMWNTPTTDSMSTVMGTKETYDYGHMHDNAPLAMQSIDYNHVSEYSYNQVYPTESQYDQYWSQVNAAPPVTPIFLKKEHSSTATTSTPHPAEEETSQIDAAKRKQLPAWIREGLEKMEQERIKRLQKERAAKERAEKLAQAELKNNSDLEGQPDYAVPVKSKFESDSDVDGEDDATSQKMSESPDVKRSPSPIEDTRTEEEKREELMLRVRRLLTEILLTVTNEEMYAIAQEVLNKEKLKARQLASSASLTSVASGLSSLASYGSESEASGSEEDKATTDSDEELQQRIKEKRRLFAMKEKKILAELEKKELEKQNETLQAKDENTNSVDTKLEESEVPPISSNDVVTSLSNSEPVAEISNQHYSEILSSNDINISSYTENKEDNGNSVKEFKKANSKDSHSSEISSNSGSESENSDKHKNKSNKNEREKRVIDKSKDFKKARSPTRKHRRSRSSDSDSSGRARKNSSSYDKSSKKSISYKKKKKYKRSDSSSSSNSSHRRRKSDSNRSHREHRSDSYEDREKRRRSASPRHYSSRDSRRSRDSYSHRYEKYKRRDKNDRHYHGHTRSPSPHKRSSKLPKKYRCSRSLSSESEYSGKKLKKSRNH